MATRVAGRILIFAFCKDECLFLKRLPFWKRVATRRILKVDDDGLCDARDGRRRTLDVYHVHRERWHFVYNVSDIVEGATVSFLGTRKI